MKSVKSYDFFQKISYEVSKPTLIGALISSFTIIMLGSLIIKETLQFITPSLKKDTIIYQDSSEQLEAHFSISLINAPCSILSVDQEDSLGIHQMNIENGVTKTRITKNHQILTEHVNPYKTSEIKRALDETEGCLVEGSLKLNKVPGNIHISYHAFRNMFDYLKNQEPNYYSKLKLRHRINYFKFGEKELSDSILDKFGINEHTLFNQEMPDFKNEPVNENFDYFLKIIPYLFNDQSSNTEFMGYQYSLNFRTRRADSDEMPILMINYDMSHITMKVTLESKSLGQFLIDVCAIVGGVFVIMSIINRILVTIFDSFLNKD